MTTVKPTGADLETLKKAAVLLKKANKLFGIAKKDSDAAKSKIIEWLKTERKVNVDALPIDEMVMLEDVCLITIAKQNRFDEEGFLLVHADLHAKWKKDFPTKRFKPLV